jgi:hypothetical protein
MQDLTRAGVFLSLAILLEEEAQDGRSALLIAKLAE